MFTGIVRERGRVVSLERRGDALRLEIEAPLAASRSAVGDSVSINGCCLTAVAIRDGRIAFDAVPETVERTTLVAVAEGVGVNVEGAVRAGEPLGGHYVQGHVDGVGTVRAVEREGDGVRIWIAGPPSILDYCVEKGSIAVDGVSLTIADLAPDAFAVALVPHTLEETTLGGLEPGAQVNLEADVLAKYVERLVKR